MKIPKWAKNHLTENDLLRIEAEVRSIESKSSVEVVPMVVLKSANFDHVDLLLFLVLALFTFLSGLWNFQLFHWDQPLAWLAINALVCFVISEILAILPFFQRWLTDKPAMIERVQRRAELEFYNLKIDETHARTGILIFISLTEHQVVVLGDKSVASKVPPETWGKLVEDVVGGIKSKSLADGLISGLQSSQKLLAKDFPSSVVNRNEIPDALIFKA